MPVNLPAQFNSTLSSLLPERCQQLVIALSGGLDSVVLLYLSHNFIKDFAKDNQLHIKAVHVDHGLSPNSKDWQLFCEKLCKALEIDFVCECVELNVQARQSLEALARELRYAVLAKHCDEDSVLLTGQHSDDQVETYLLQLKRGAGIKGLSAMAAIREFGNSYLLRPLLDLSRQSLYDYAMQQELEWIEDESNRDESFDRNFLRHSIIPKLKQRWAGFAKAVGRSAQLAAQAQSLCEEVAEQDLKTCEPQNQTHAPALNIEALAKLSELRRNNALRHWLALQGACLPSQKQLEQLWYSLALSQEDAYGHVSWSDHEMRRFQGHLFLLSNEKLKLNNQVIDAKHFAQLDEQGFVVNISALDKNLYFKLSNQEQSLRLPLMEEVVTLRFGGSGALCQPVGRIGSRKYKKLMQEYQVPPWQRSQIPLIYYDEQLVAAVGLWQDERYTVTEADKGMELNLS